MLSRVKIKPRHRACSVRHTRVLGLKHLTFVLCPSPKNPCEYLECVDFILPGTRLSRSYILSPISYVYLLTDFLTSHKLDKRNQSCLKKPCKLYICKMANAFSKKTKLGFCFTGSGLIPIPSLRPKTVFSPAVLLYGISQTVSNSTAGQKSGGGRTISLRPDCGRPPIFSADSRRP